MVTTVVDLRRMFRILIHKNIYLYILCILHSVQIGSASDVLYAWTKVDSMRHNNSEKLSTFQHEHVSKCRHSIQTAIIYAMNKKYTCETSMRALLNIEVDQHSHLHILHAMCHIYHYSE